MLFMKSLPLLLLFANFLYGSAVSSAIFGRSRSAPSKKTDRALPPLVPPKLVDDDDDFDERDLSPAHHVQLPPSYWAPTLETLGPEEAEFYRKALVDAVMKRGDGRSMSMLRMGRGVGGVRRRSADGVRRSMTMLRMGRSFDGEEEEEKRSMGMLRMGRGATEDDYRKSMSMLRMGRGAMADEDEQQQQLKRSMGMLRMGRSLGEEQEDEEEAAAEKEEEGKRSMGMLRMGRALGSNKSVDRGALNMLRMGKREAMSSEEERGSRGVAADKTSSSTSN